MNSEKVKEIKKALEDNAHYKHHDKLSYIDGYKCKLIAYADILTLINELESENERLNSRHRNLKINYNKTWKQYREYEVENQQLKDRIAELEKGNEALSFAVKQGFNDCQHKTLQEFAKWLAKRSNNEIYIDLVKEYINE